MAASTTAAEVTPRTSAALTPDNNTAVADSLPASTFKAFFNDNCVLTTSVYAAAPLAMAFSSATTFFNCSLAEVTQPDARTPTKPPW